MVIKNILNKVFAFLLKNIKNIYVTSVVFLIFLFEFVLVYTNRLFLFFHIASSIIFIASIINYIYNIIVIALNKRKNKKLIMEEEEDCLYQIYSRLDRKEEEIFYRLFYENEVIIPHNEFDLEYRKSNFRAMFYKIANLDEYERANNENYYEILNCKEMDYKTKWDNGNCSCWYDNYRFTMNDEFRQKYKPYIEKVKNMVEKNL